MLTHVRPEDYDPDRYRPIGILWEVLSACRALPSGSTVALHGWPGSGKTPTAIWLGQRLSLPVIHLDEVRGRGGIGFDEDAARLLVFAALEAGSVIVVGVCAVRVCVPTVLIRLGHWPAQALTPSLMRFIGDYDARLLTGSIATFEAWDGLGPEG